MRTTTTTITISIDVPVGKYCENAPGPGTRLVCGQEHDSECTAFNEVLEIENGRFLKCKQCLDACEAAEKEKK